MGYPTGCTNSPDMCPEISEKVRRSAVSRGMDANTLDFLFRASERMTMTTTMTEVW
jgi:hypothetical protein